MEGNQMKMREALEYMLDFDATDDAAMDDGLTDAERIMEYADHIAECQKKARAALSAPPRNCDVGTVEEQIRRFRIFCNDHYRENGGTDVCRDCPLWTSGLIGSDCELKWAQMPYEAQEGAGK